MTNATFNSGLILLPLILILPIYIFRRISSFILIKKGVILPISNINYRKLNKIWLIVLSLLVVACIATNILSNLYSHTNKYEKQSIDAPTSAMADSIISCKAYLIDPYLELVVDKVYTEGQDIITIIFINAETSKVVIAINNVPYEIYELFFRNNNTENIMINKVGKTIYYNHRVSVFDNGYNLMFGSCVSLTILWCYAYMITRKYLELKHPLKNKATA